MAVLAAAQLLDELMGRNRNVAPSEKTKELNWEDPEYCKFYMVKFCPHDLFVNTRADLGVCSKVHDDEVKSLFEKSTSYKKQAYEDEFIRFSQAMLNEVERKIVKGKQRLALIGNKTEPPSSLSPQQTQRNQEQIALLSNKINSLVSEAEAAGIEGNVEQAQGLMKLCDQLKEEREALRKQNDNSHWSQTAELAAAQLKQMEVCEVCGAFLIVGDTQSRIDDHLMGKLHAGYSRLRQALEEVTTAEIAAAQEKQMEVCEVCGAFLIVGDAQSRIDDHLMGKQHVGYARLRMALEEIMSERAKQRDEKERRRDEERRERHKLREEEEKKKEKEREERRKKREEEERSRKHRDHGNHRERDARDWDRDAHGRHRDDRGSSRSSQQRSRSRDLHQREKERDRSRHEDRRKENGERDRERERERGRDRERRRH